MNNFLLYIVLFSASPIVAQVWFQGGVGSGVAYNDTLYCSIDANNVFSNSTTIGNGFATNMVSLCSSSYMPFQSTDSTSGFDFSEVSYCTSNTQNVLFTSSLQNSGGNFSVTLLCNSSTNLTPFRGYNGSGVDFYLGTCLVALPIELLSFDAELNNNQVDLFWTTVSEINNDYFEIERSVNTTDWEVIEEVQGAGNSSETIDYYTLDQNPIKGVSYYRLKQVDFDGNYTYSDIKVIVIHNDVSILLYPNPATDKITIEGVNLEGLVILDAYGRELTDIVIPGTKETSIIQIDLTLFTAGVYFIKVKDQTVKFIKMK